MIKLLDVDELVVGGLAVRCRCDRPLSIPVVDGQRCLKCGRTPAIRLGSAPEPTHLEGPSLEPAESAQ